MWLARLSVNTSISCVPLASNMHVADPPHSGEIENIVHEGSSKRKAEESGKWSLLRFCGTSQSLPTRYATAHRTITLEVKIAQDIPRGRIMQFTA